MSAWTHFPDLASIAGGALIASPNRGFREQVLDRLQGRCRPVGQALGGADALAKLAEGNWPFLFLDRRVHDLDTEELIAIVEKRFPGIQVVLLDSAGGICADDGESVPSAEASPFVCAPQRIAPQDSNAKNAGRIAVAAPLPGMIGESQAMLHVYRLARLVAPRSTTVLIAGATGSGKELVA
ncbi:MAG: sigma 54-interacting transcriptional regulator, partial [Candidatus Sulfotelmatobacter sp.]